MLRVPPAVVDFIGWLAIFFWLAVSGFGFYVYDAALFQNAGCIGVAAAVAYFGLQRHAIPLSAGVREELTWMNARLNLLQAEILQINGRHAILARSLALESERSGKAEGSVFRALADIPSSDIAAAVSASPASANLALLGISRGQRGADMAVRDARRKSETVQLLVVVLATLQSGLGGYLVDLF